SPHVGRVLVVDDGSQDDTAARAEAAGAEVLRLACNLGKATALQAGFDYAVEKGYAAVVILDGDGQHDPEEIPALAKVWREERAHIVAGNRMLAAGKRMPLPRRMVNEFTAWLGSHIAGQPLPDCHCGFRLVDSEVLRSFRLQTKRFAGDTEMLIWSAIKSFRISFVPIRCIYTGGKSGIRPIPDAVRLLAFAVRALTERVRLKWRR
ncbi:MAG: glycosyltransferase family 2 protein, partial [Planctomycetota bacterium]